MQTPTLLILAAGMGSRFGGLKQFMPFGPNGESIIDYSLYDARLAGFKRAVIVLKPGMDADFRAHLGASVNAGMQVDFTFQELGDLPAGFVCPDARVRPWGTGHAVYAARKMISGPFGVIGADDFFGRDAFVKLYSFLSSQSSPESLSMVGYRLENTLSATGSVSRGVCEVKDGMLASVTERTSISRMDGGIYYEEGGMRHALDPESVVSLNVWGLHAGLFERMEADLAEFLASPDGDELKREYYLPAFVDRLIGSGAATVRVLEAQSRWYGVTHKDDSAALSAALNEMHGSGEYPRLVW